MAIRTLDSLRQHLQASVEVGHATLPPYLCALYSIKAGHNLEAAEAIRSVLMEEMLHLTLAANLLNAVGGTPEIDHPGFLLAYPAPLPHSNRAFEVPLLKFSPEAVDVFMRIEKPSPHEAMPEDDAFETVGQFYQAIREAVIRLTRDLGEDRVFSGDPTRQITNELYDGGSGRIIPVADLPSALAAIDEITDQGEGLQHELAAYFRFDEIRRGRRYRRGDSPQSGPTGEPLVVDWDAVHPTRPNPRCADYAEGTEVRTRMEAFNHAYSGVLHLLQQCFNGSPRLLGVAAGAMYALRDEAAALMQVPTGDGRTTAGPSFEYVPPAARRQAPREQERVVITRDGPYVVYGRVPLVRKRRIVAAENGRALAWEKTIALETEEVYALCRCGQSGSKPFCDGTHARSGFDGTETADTRPIAERQRVLTGPGLVVKRDPSLCIGVGFCSGRLKKIPDLMADAADSDVRARIMGMVGHCPSGSYTYATSQDAPDVEPDLPAAIAVLSENETIAGCLWVTGGIPIERSDGLPVEIRNRVTLCRCGHSENKPFCDGMHKKIGFREERS